MADQRVEDDAQASTATAAVTGASTSPDDPVDHADSANRVSPIFYFTYAPNTLFTRDANSFAPATAPWSGRSVRTTLDPAQRRGGAQIRSRIVCHWPGCDEEGVKPSTLGKHLRTHNRSATQNADWNILTLGRFTDTCATLRFPLDGRAVKEGVEEYLKAEPGTTYTKLEEAFRAQDLKLYLTSLENLSLLLTYTHMDLQTNGPTFYGILFLTLIDL
ncbi:hypothetical protein Hte_008762 [Hypoxylon texense]